MLDERDGHEGARGAVVRRMVDGGWPIAVSVGVFMFGVADRVEALSPSLISSPESGMSQGAVVVRVNNVSDEKQTDVLSRSIFPDIGRCAEITFNSVIPREMIGPIKEHFRLSALQNDGLSDSFFEVVFIVGQGRYDHGRHLGKEFNVGIALDYAPSRIPNVHNGISNLNPVIGSRVHRRHITNNQFGPVGGHEFLSGKLSGGERGGYSSLQLKALPCEYQQLEECDDRQGGRRTEKPFRERREAIIIRRLFVFACCVGGGLLLTLRGWQYFYNERSLFGATLIGAGCLIGLGGLALWWADVLTFAWGGLL
jgi:hypothetical protein